MKIIFLLLFCVLIFPCEVLSEAQEKPQEPIVHTTEVDVEADQAIGSEYRSQINSVVRFIKQKEFERADKVLDNVIQAFKDNIIPNNSPFIVAQSKAEFDEILKEQKLEKAAWLDWSYKEVYFLKAFIASEHKDSERALKYLEIVISFSPYDARARCEHGFILNRLRKPEEALSEYQTAFELTKKFQFNKVVQGAALRGMGYAYIELGELDKAEDVYRRSLEVDKGNKLALQELAYIENLKKKKK